MKKIFIVVPVLAMVLLSAISCSKGTTSPSATPTPNATMPPLLVDDFEAGNTFNAMGGGWYTYGDTAFGGSNAAPAGMVFASGDTVTAVHSLEISGSSTISTNIAHPPTGGYYGFIGACTTFTAMNLSAYKGIRFYAKTYYQPTSANDKMNVWVASQYEVTHNVQSHYRAQLDAPLGNTWYYYEIPWSAFTQDYVYDSNYPSHPRTRSQVLQDAVMVGFDKEYVYASTGLPPSSWSQMMFVDDVELY